jgi:hypothetical protein
MLTSGSTPRSGRSNPSPQSALLCPLQALARVICNRQSAVPLLSGASRSRVMNFWQSDRSCTQFHMKKWFTRSSKGGAQRVEGHPVLHIKGQNPQLHSPTCATTHNSSSWWLRQVPQRNVALNFAACAPAAAASDTGTVHFARGAGPRSVIDVFRADTMPNLRHASCQPRWLTTQRT